MSAPAQLPGVPPQPKNGLGTAGFVLGLVGLVFSPIPIVGMVAWPLVIIGLILSILGVARANKGQATNRGLAIAGTVLSALGLVICVVWAVVFGIAVNAVQEEASREVNVTYQVSGDAPAASVSYSTFKDGNVSSSTEEVTSLPWTKELKTSALLSGGTLMVTTDERGGTVTCTVTVEGKEPVTNTATGAFAVATCSGF